MLEAFPQEPGAGRDLKGLRISGPFQGGPRVIWPGADLSRIPGGFLSGTEGIFHDTCRENISNSTGRLIADGFFCSFRF